MVLNPENAFDFLKDNSGRLTIFLGIGFLVLGILFVGMISHYFWISGISLFLGVILTCLGFLIEIDFYSTLSFVGKLGAILVTAALILFASALMTMVLREMVSVREVGPLSLPYGHTLDWQLIPLTIVRYGWVTFPFLIAGLFLLVTGAVLKIYSDCL